MLIFSRNCLFITIYSYLVLLHHLLLFLLFIHTLSLLLCQVRLSSIRNLIRLCRLTPPLPLRVLLPNPESLHRLVVHINYMSTSPHISSRLHLLLYIYHSISYSLLLTLDNHLQLRLNNLNSMNFEIMLRMPNYWSGRTGSYYLVYH